MYNIVNGLNMSVIPADTQMQEELSDQLKRSLLEIEKEEEEKEKTITEQLKKLEELEDLVKQSLLEIEKEEEKKEEWITKQLKKQKQKPKPNFSDVALSPLEWAEKNRQQNKRILDEYVDNDAAFRVALNSIGGKFKALGNLIRGGKVKERAD